MKTDIQNIKCPFCSCDMKVDYDYTTTTSCCGKCRFPPYDRYTVTYDVFTNMYWVTIIFEEKEEYYSISIRYDMEHTWMERLIKVSTPGAEDYYLPVTVIEVNAALPFDVATPIESGRKILNKLLGLRAFS